jgi:amidophosphoribosyltransferase
MPSRSELVAHGRDTQAISSAIGADLVIFQTLPDLISSVRQFNEKIETFDCSVFTGEYITGGVDEQYLRRLEDLRCDKAQTGAVGEFETTNGRKTNGMHLTNGINGVLGDREELIGSSGPVNGADDTVGLHNSWKSS